MVNFNYLVPVLGWLLATASASPTSSTARANTAAPFIIKGPSQSNRTALAANSIPVFTAYVNFNATGHQFEFNELSAAGYRMISLSVYGQPPNHLYAAVWVQRSGPEYAAIAEASGSQFQAFFDAHNGFASTLISVTGPPGGEIFAGVMEKNGVTNWFQQCGYTTAQYQSELANAASTGYILKSFTEYGTTSERLYCGTWYHNDQNQPSTSFIDESYDGYQQTFNSQVANAGWRPGYLSVSEDHLISSEFVNTNVGSWVARHAMDTDDLLNELNTQLAAGLYPIHLQGGGTGDNVNFAALWAQQDIPF
ncbi:hypothetical protein GALMADRAFT_231859 [Galerina marginata CBS 339.88]|uniref:Enterotoxin n=1 Tax=Galerina marginata (strain CBS 339.88) TaxID=685588 RepID=A0A067S9V7_GALM3|nr:hypothetical protein GALMADRAFT_231859 [Galerina marginata CBS 339.88]